ncbi:MAG: hypothetical protein ACYTDT_07130 [Planctomycetota bacterium]|jgi:hypothetical protein
MKTLIFCLTIFAGALAAQPIISVSHFNQPVVHASSFQVEEGSTVFGADIDITVDHPTSDSCSVSATISSNPTGQFINWSAADFNHIPQATSYSYQVTPLIGTAVFGSTGTIYTCNLTANDSGAGSNTIGFTIEVVPVGSLGAGGSGDGGGGGCVATSTNVSGVIGGSALFAILAVYRRRRRRLT